MTYIYKFEYDCCNIHQSFDLRVYQSVRLGLPIEGRSRTGMFALLFGRITTMEN